LSSIEIGGATPAGSATYADGKWSVSGAGAEIWGANDSCHFSYKVITGDGAIIAKVDALQNTSLPAKAGVMMRTSLDQGAPRAWMAITNRLQAEQNIQNLAVYGGNNYGNKALAVANTAPSYWLSSNASATSSPATFPPTAPTGPPRTSAVSTARCPRRSMSG
jgi:hypothetical protein